MFFKRSTTGAAGIGQNPEMTTITHKASKTRSGPASRETARAFCRIKANQGQSRSRDVLFLRGHLVVPPVASNPDPKSVGTFHLAGKSSSEREKTDPPMRLLYPFAANHPALCYFVTSLFNLPVFPCPREMGHSCVSCLIRFPELFNRWRGEPAEAPRSRR